MWSNSRTSKTLVIVVCFLVVGIAGCGNGIGSHGGDATMVAPSHSYPAPSTTVSIWKCGSFIQVVYNAVFHVVSGPKGGTIVFSYTVNNGRSQTPEKLTILPGQHLSNFVFTWQGSLPSDHTFPAPGGVLVTSPNHLISQRVVPAGRCR